MTKKAAVIFSILTIFIAGAWTPARAEGLNEIVSQSVDLFAAKDAFSGIPSCSIAGAKLFRAYSLEEAVKALKPCINAVSARYSTELSVDAAMPQAQGLMSMQVQMILIRVPATLAKADPLYRDLGYSLTLRNGRLLGHPTQIERPETTTTSLIRSLFSPSKR